MEFTSSMRVGERCKPRGDAIGFEASEDITEGTPVTLNADGTVAAAGSGDYVLGSLKMDTSAGESTTVYTHGAIGYNVDPAVEAGDHLEANASNVLAAVPGDGSGTQNNLMAITSATDDGEAVVLRV